MPPRSASTIAATATALLGPPLAGLATIFIAARGSPLPVPLCAALAFVVLGGAVVLAWRGRGLLRLAAPLPGAAFVAFLLSHCASPLPRPAPFTGPLPAAWPPSEMAIYQLPTGVIHRTAAFAYRGGAFSDRRDFAMNAVLITHPRGDLLIDAGLGRDVAAQLLEMPRSFRLLTHLSRGASAAEQLDAAGYDRARLRAILLTHAHWDHASGLPELPGVPVLVTAEERRFIDDGGWLTAIARRTPAARFQTFTFEGPPYLGFERSHDLHGDGSIVVVPAPGHTPGSVIVFVALPGGRRYAFVGDLAWQREGITELEERPWIVRRQADLDPAAVRAGLTRMAALAARAELTLVPAHDARGYADLPRLPRFSGEVR